eukprot:3085989-Rhodomonas_salina.4
MLAFAVGLGWLWDDGGGVCAGVGGNARAKGGGGARAARGDRGPGRAAAAGAGRLRSDGGDRRAHARAPARSPPAVRQHRTRRRRRRSCSFSRVGCVDACSVC